METGALAANVFLPLVCYLPQYPREDNFIVVYSIVPSDSFIFVNSEKSFLAQEDIYILFSVVRKYHSPASLHHNGKAICFLGKWRAAFMDRKEKNGTKRELKQV